jgi:hypothetical protein
MTYFGKKFVGPVLQDDNFRERFLKGYGCEKIFSMLVQDSLLIHRKRIIALAYFFFAARYVY